MKFRLFNALLAVCATISSLNAQMKLGDNPNAVAANAAFQVEKGGNQVLIDTTGKLGVGTTTPIAALDVNGKMTVRNGIITNATTVAGVPSTTTDLGLYSSGGWMRYVTTNAPHHWFTDGGGGSTAKMSLMDDGKLGVGTNAPSAKLDVNGNARVRTLPAGASGDVMVSADADGNLRKLTITQLSALGIMTKAFVSPNSGATGGNIPCSAGYDVINYDASDGNYSATITLPNCGSPGQKIVVRSAATSSAIISKTNTVGLGTWTVQTGDVYEFTYMNNKWELTASPTKSYSFCAAPNNSSANLLTPTTPKTIMAFGDACWTATVTLPSGGTVGDTYMINDGATFNLTLSNTNTTMAANLVITAGSFVRFVKTPQGWARDL